MRTISLFLQLIGLAVVAVLGYWAWYANWGPNPHDKVGVNVAAFVPVAVRDWGCTRLRQRFAAETPAICAPALPGPSVPAPSAPEPSAPAEGGGRL